MVPAVLRDRTFLTGDWACTYKVASGVSNLIGSASAHFADLKSDISKIREVSKKKSESASSPIDAHSVWGTQIKKAPAGTTAGAFLARGSERASLRRS